MARQRARAFRNSRPAFRPAAAFRRAILRRFHSDGGPRFASGIGAGLFSRLPAVGHSASGRCPPSPECVAASHARRRRIPLRLQDRL
jgi:hypothetical protein